MLQKLILLSVLGCTGCAHMANDQWTGQDKAQHFIASAMLAAAGDEYGHRQGWSDSHSASFGLIFSLSLGLTKEFYDSRPKGSGFSWRDFAWDTAGAVTGYSVWSLAH